MLGRIIEISEDNRYLFVERGFLVVRATHDEANVLGRVPLDDVLALIGNAHGLSYSNNVLVELAKRGTPFVLCAANHNAVGYLLSVEGNYQQAKRMDAQIAATKPQRKRLWADIVKAKITQQITTLTNVNVNVNVLQLKRLIKQVKAGDTTNIEAQAARKYWGLLMGATFRRDQSGGGANALLNYGYTVLRACTARAVVAAGLHPTLGLHHSNEGNAMRLVDDLMEPFRPLIDLAVWQLIQADSDCQVDKYSKLKLVNSLFQDLQTKQGISPATTCIQRLATSLAQIYLGEKLSLELPLAIAAPQINTDD
jgi:CRISP-associated protein Cas1